jgi:hypothetical protein
MNRITPFQEASYARPCFSVKCDRVLQAAKHDAAIVSIADGINIKRTDEEKEKAASPRIATVQLA